MKVFSSKLSRILQGKSKSKNQKAFDALTQIGFSPAQARRMLIAGNEIRVKHLAKNSEVTAPTIYAAVYGKRNNYQGQSILSQALGVPMKELFPDKYGEAANG